MAELDERLGTVSTKGVGPHTNVSAASSGATSREQLAVDPPRVAGPAVGLLARERVDDVEPGRRSLELVAVDHVVHVRTE